MSPVLLDYLYLAGAAFGLPFLVYKGLTSPRFRAGWDERFGRVPEFPPGHRIWIHCASVGEVLLARTLVTRLGAEYPRSDLVVSTNTSTGREAARKHLPGLPVFYFPLDLSPVVRRVLGRVQPAAVVLVELELWPNFLGIARERGVPVVVVNGRITERAAGRYRRLGGFARRMFRSVEQFAVQNEEYARRLQGLGVAPGRVSIAGTMKYDTVATEVEPEVVEGYRKTFRLGPGDVVLVGGCTHPGEDELLIDYAKARSAGGRPIRLILAPRHRRNVERAEHLVRAAGMIAIRKTALDAGAAPETFADQPHVLLVDTTGELARVYAVATAVFVGGSLVPHGGQNMIEPAALGKPVLFGPHTWNFRDTVERLLGGGGAIEVRSPAELPAALDRILDDATLRRTLGTAARTLIEEARGATERNLAAIKPVLDATLPQGA